MAWLGGASWGWARPGEAGQGKALGIDNKRMDTMYKHGLLRFEPWKIAFTAFGAGAAALAAVIAALNYFHH
jgi:hypothetical protein